MENLNLTKEEKEELLDDLLELYDSDKDDYHYLNTGMAKLLLYLDMQVPTKLNYSISNGRKYTIEFLTDDEKEE